MLIRVQNKWLIRILWRRWDVPTYVIAQHTLLLWWLKKNYPLPWSRTKEMELFLSRQDLLPKHGGRFFTFMRLVRCAWFPCLLSISALAGAILIGHDVVDVPYRIIPVIFLLAFGLTLFVDMLAKLSDYQYYSSTNEVLNSLRLMTKLRKSFCSRQVAIALYGDTARKFYRSLGYRWYHIFPDGVFCRKSVFFRREFWRVVLRGRN